MGLIDRIVSFSYDPSKITRGSGYSVYPGADFAKSVCQTIRDVLSTIGRPATINVSSDGTNPTESVESYIYYAHILFEGRDVPIYGWTYINNTSKPYNIFGADFSANNTGIGYYRLVVAYNNKVVAIAVSNATSTSDSPVHNWAYIYNQAYDVMNDTNLNSSATVQFSNNKPMNYAWGFEVQGKVYTVYPYENMSALSGTKMVFSDCYSNDCRFRFDGMKNISRCTDVHITDSQNKQYICFYRAAIEI